MADLEERDGLIVVREPQQQEPRESVPSESEIRVAQAQLVGWLEGLFHGIQAAMWAQHMQAQAQFEAMRRRALPQGIPQLQAAKSKAAQAEPKEGGYI